MTKEKYYVYDYADELKPGKKIKIEHELRIYENGIDDLIGMDEKTIKELKEKSMTEENAIFQSLKEKAKEWAEKAYQTKMYDEALEYLHIPEVEHTSNRWRWVENEYHNEWHISNKVYSMHFYIYDENEYNRETKKCERIAWRINWNVTINNPKRGYGEHIAGQERKRFTDHDAAMKYIEGRKKAYANLFTEISPPIPKEYAEGFKVYGVLLPGYSIKDEEKNEDEKTL